MKVIVISMKVIFHIILQSPVNVERTLSCTHNIGKETPSSAHFLYPQTPFPQSFFQCYTTWTAGKGSVWLRTTNTLESTASHSALPEHPLPPS
jgi:hypothetical protein